MSQTLGISDLGSVDYPVSIFASNRETPQVPNITLGAGQGVVLKGTCLGIKTADGKYYKYKSDASDGTEVFVGILGVEVDTTSADALAFMYVGGDFLKENLFAYEEADVPAAGAYVYNNIIIKEGV